MGVRILKGQVIASTHVDSHNERLPKEYLQSIFERIPDPYIMCQGHDLSKPPAGKLFNKQLRETTDGEWEFIADVELWDDNLQIQPGGFSFSGKLISKGVAQQTADIELLYNPRLIDESLVKQALNEFPESLRIQAVQLVQKGETPLLIIILSFAAVGIASGFFGKIGSDLWDKRDKVWDWMVDLCENVRKSTGSETPLQFHYRYPLNDSEVLVVMTASPSTFKALRITPIDLDEIRRSVANTVGTSKVLKVVIELLPEPPHWEIRQIVDSQGSLIQL